MKNLILAALTVPLLTAFASSTANARQICISKSAISSYKASNTKRIAKSKAIANWNRRVQNTYYGNASLNWNNAHNRNIRYTRKSSGYRATASGTICINRRNRCAPSDLRCQTKK